MTEIKVNKMNVDNKIELLNNDLVNHPSHYCREGGMEAIDEMLMFFGREEVKTFCKLNAWKYRYRASDKNGKEDIKKSDWYVKKYKELSEELCKCANTSL